MSERVWFHGWRSGFASAWVAITAIAEADRLLELCRFTPGERRAAWQQAQDDAREEHPSLPPALLRALAARRLQRLLTERLALHIHPSTEALAAE